MMEQFSTIPRPVENFFKSSGIYNATAFTDDQKEKDGIDNSFRRMMETKYQK